MRANKGFFLLIRKISGSTVVVSFASDHSACRIEKQKEKLNKKKTKSENKKFTSKENKTVSLETVKKL